MPVLSVSKQINKYKHVNEKIVNELVLHERT